jgi:hypothetical protein
MLPPASVHFHWTLQDTVQYLGVPVHIADANNSGRDIGPFDHRRGWIRRHEKCLAPVQDLDYPAVERTDLRATLSGE